MLRSELAKALLPHRENDIKIGLTNETSETLYTVTIEDIVYDSNLDTILIRGRRTFPEDVADDMQSLLRELDGHLADVPQSFYAFWYDAWRQRCADALGLSVDEL